MWDKSSLKVFFIVNFDSHLHWFWDNSENFVDYSLTNQNKHVSKQERHSDLVCFHSHKTRFHSNKRLSDHLVDVDSLKLLSNANTVVSFLFLLNSISTCKRSHTCLDVLQEQTRKRRHYSFKCVFINY